MSLQALRELRLSGARPDGVVSVLIGRRPAWHDNGPTLIEVLPGDKPATMDFRPTIGIWVALYSADHRRAGEVMDALKTAGAKFFGAALAGETYPCTADPSDAHHNALRSQWEALCL